MSGHTYVLGIPVEHEKTASLLRTVMSIASAMSLLALISCVLQFYTGSYFSIGIMAAVVVPLCGYCGALNRSRSALMCFSISNIILALVFVASVVVALTQMGGDLPTCACNRTCAAQYGIDPTNAADICANAGRYRTLWWLAIAFGSCMVVLQLLGCYYGFKLASSPHFKLEAAIPVAEPVVATYVVEPQPPAVVYVPGDGYYPYNGGVIYSRGAGAGAVRVGHRSMSEGAYYVTSPPPRYTYASGVPGTPPPRAGPAPPAAPAAPAARGPAPTAPVPNAGSGAAPVYKEQPPTRVI